MKSVTIIGGGLSGLSASCYLAKKNYKVTIVDKNNTMGGRLSSFEVDGFTFDMGPSWYWMPDIFEDFFTDFNRDINDYYKLERLNPSYKFFFEDDTLDISKDFDDLCKIFEEYESGSSLQLKNFINEANMKYKISMKDFIEKANISFKEYLSFSIIRHFRFLTLTKPLRKHIASYFKHKKLRNILEFPSMFLGGSPQNTPALYSLMNYADIINGTWYPMGGMIEITKGFIKLSKELGVNHVLNEDIDNLNITQNSIDYASSSSSKYKSDFYICCAEYPHVQTKLLSAKHRSYTSNYWDKKNVAPSSLIFYLGISKKIPNLEHHNLFFDEDFDTHLDEIFNKKIWPENPLFYVCCPSKTDKTVVPDQKSENLFILVPIGPGSQDNDSIREKYFTQIIERIEKRVGLSIKDNIIVKKSFCVKDFKSRYNAYKGNAYGLANTLLQTAIFKPKIKDKKIENLYYSGHFTVPGPGLPPAIISGKIAAKEIIKETKS